MLGLKLIHASKKGPQVIKPQIIDLGSLKYVTIHQKKSHHKS